MFELSKIEFEKWRSQIVISNSDKMGLRYAPMAFTEQGVAMLSSVLKSNNAIQVNIQIMRTFTKLRRVIFDNEELKKEFGELKSWSLLAFQHLTTYRLMRFLYCF